jgi:hypothetical protein
MSTSDFTAVDLAQLEARGIALEEAQRQLQLLRTPPPATKLDRPCTVGDGIVRLDPSQHDELVAAGEQAAVAGRVTKFVPASGAATRMFKDLITALSGNDPPSHSPAGRLFFDRLDDFPFAEDVRRLAKVTGPIRSVDEERSVLRTLLHVMRYAELPKALIAFHRGDRARTAFEEQLLEGAQYTRDRDGLARTHFTVAPEFRGDFERVLASVIPRVHDHTNGAVLSVTFSEQHPSTDTLAITPDGVPLRGPDGSVLFRPAGHGALLPNLRELDADLVVIKNIDNVVPHERSAEVVTWKRLLLGYLVRLHRDTCDLLRRCLAVDAGDEVLERAMAVAARRFGRVPSTPIDDRKATLAFIADALDRPLRVCGVVKNEGEPGGAPFWVVDTHLQQSVQLVESSQVNLADADQRRIFESSTHFNPVDIVVSLRSCDGTPFDLARFVDPHAVFLSRKSHLGRDVIALERPGLWNGGMAHWNTVFVEVPASTFAPVKTVFDLLRPEHQSL